MKRRLWMVLFATIVGLFSRSLRAQTLTYHGGYLIAHPKIVVSYWNWPGADPANVKSSVDGMMSGIGGSKYIGLISQYSTLSNPINNDLSNIPPAKWSDPTPWPTDTAGDRHPNQADVVAAVQRAETHFGGWAKDTIIFIVTGPNRTYYGGGGCAYHSWRTNGTTGHTTIFAEVPYQADTQVPARWNGVCPPQGGTTTGEFEAVVAYHELVEAITDPSGGGWFEDRTNNEVADYTNNGPYRHLRLDNSGRLYPVQTLLSSNSGGSGAFYFANKVNALGSGLINRAYWVDNLSHARALNVPFPNGNPTPDSFGSSTYSTGVGAVYEAPGIVDSFYRRGLNIELVRDTLGGAPNILNAGGPEAGATWAFTPDAASSGGGNVQVFATETFGCIPTSCNNRIRRRSRTAGVWAAWETLPVPTSGVGSGPGAIGMGAGWVYVGGISWGYAPIAVAVLDQSTPPHLLTATQIGPTFSWTWTDQGAPTIGGSPVNLVGSPDVSSNDVGQFDVWVADDSGALYQFHAEPTTPGNNAWISRGIPMTPTGIQNRIKGDVTAVSAGDDVVYVVAAVGTNQVVLGNYDAGTGAVFTWGDALAAPQFVHNGFGWDMTCR